MCNAEHPCGTPSSLNVARRRNGEGRISGTANNSSEYPCKCTSSIAPPASSPFQSRCVQHPLSFVCCHVLRVSHFFRSAHCRARSPRRDFNSPQVINAPRSRDSYPLLQKGPTLICAAACWPPCTPSCLRPPTTTKSSSGFNKSLLHK